MTHHRHHEHIDFDNRSSKQCNSPMAPQHKPKFIENVRLIRKQQDILERLGDPLSISVFTKLEDIMQGQRGIRFTGQEAGRREYAFELAKCELAKENAEHQWQRYESSTVTARKAAEETQRQQRQQEVQA